MWFDDFYAQALLINKHEYFSGQVSFQLHSACDAMIHLKKKFFTHPFNMKVGEENIVFWRTLLRLLSSNHQLYHFYRI